MSETLDLPLPDDIVKELCGLAASTDEEVCGLFVKDQFLAIIVCNNVAQDRKNEYEFDTEELAEIYNTNKVVGVWHTHPSGDITPSEADIVEAHQRRIPHFIVTTRGITRVMASEKE